MAILLFLVINLILFKPILLGLMPLPLDALAGVYYPWAGHFWGYLAGIPYKNIALTDVFSQLYPWRALAMDIFRSGHLPLWNNLSFSGSPLLANWQSASFYPLNILMLLLGNIHGFSAMIFLQPFLSMLFLYLFLRQIKISKVGSIIGAITFALSGFSLTYLEYATSGQIFIWLPLALLFLEKYLNNAHQKYLVYFAFCFFPIFTGGFFQPALYVSLIIFLYASFRIVNDESLVSKSKTFLKVIVFMLLGCSTAALQLLPTAELLSLSIRNLDHNITEYHYGLLPIQNLITFMAPDFFGNPVTQNFWGFMQYQETAGYFSLTALILVLARLFSKNKTWTEKLFFGLFLSSLSLAFNNPLSRLVYQFHLPLISTGYASRWLMVTTFSASILAALSYDRLTKKSYFFSSLFTFILSVSTYLIVRSNLLGTAISLEHQSVALRNLLLPLVILTVLGLSVIVYNFRKLFSIVLVTILIFDLLRFSIKFTPFSPASYVNQTQPTFEFLKSHLQENRVAAESGPVLPANTWLYEKLPSPSGYDPLVFKDYGTFFAGLNVGTSSASFPGTAIVNDTYTRYLNIVNYRSLLVDLTGTKYFLALKTKDGKIELYGKYDQGSFPVSKYSKVFEDGKVVVLENKTVMPRAKLYYQAQFTSGIEDSINKLAKGFNFHDTLLVDQNHPTTYSLSPTDTVNFNQYEPNAVSLSAYTKNGAYLFLSDVMYPGWKVSINGQKKVILTTFGIFRGVELPPGNSTVVFQYTPHSFQIGLVLSIISLALILIYFKYGAPTNS